MSEKWDNLINYFPQPFNTIHDIRVYLFLDFPRIFSFKNVEDKLFIAYIGEFNYENYDATWIIAEVDLGIINNMVSGKILIKETLINHYHNEYKIIINEDEESVQSINDCLEIENLIPSDSFYLTTQIPNEIDLYEFMNVKIGINYKDEIIIDFNEDVKSGIGGNLNNTTDNNFIEIRIFDEILNIEKISSQRSLNREAA